jgi:glyoxylase-like metal-dependent hydrolase (beta-lactamase superfamily II)
LGSYLSGSLLWQRSPRGIGALRRTGAFVIAPHDPTKERPMDLRWLVLAMLLESSASFGQTPSTVDRLYVLDCGQGRAADQSRWSPGVNVGVPIDLVNHCYLIKHAQGWMIWDTGVPERVADMPDGLLAAGGALVWKRPRTIAEQLAELGISAGDVSLVAVSHTHPDHVGNVDMFSAAMVLIQRAEYDWAFAQPNTPFSAEHATRKLDGDFDVFGDGSVRIISTPGHTPGHQSLLVRLANTGAVLLSGDAVHFRDNWENRRVPSMNVNREQTLTSMQRIADVLLESTAALWIQHEAQGERLRLAPAFYD